MKHKYSYKINDKRMQGRTTIGWQQLRVKITRAKIFYEQKN